MKQMMKIALLVLVTSGAYAQHDHPAPDVKKMDQDMVMFKDEKLAEAYKHYSSLKDALVRSDKAEAGKAAYNLQTSLLAVKEGKKAAGEAAKLSASSSLDGQRKAFSSLTNEMTSLLKGGKLSMGELYVDYCPMANSNEGAFWISSEKEIKNPYFGSKMLKCGSVKETIQ